METRTIPSDSNRDPDDATLDTIALLQDEIARLEAVLQSLDSEPDGGLPAPSPDAEAAEATRRIEELTTLLDERDETIALLWEQLSAHEQAQASRAADLDQLHRWVEELESRFGAEEGPAALESARREADALRDELDRQRRAWDAQRSRMEEELASLRRRADEAASSSGDSALAALEEENRRLHDECRRLSEAQAGTAGADRQLLDLQAELDEARQRLRQAEDDLRAERLRFESHLAECRPNPMAGPLSAADLSPSERVRALREHLKELHAREEAERREKQLSTRIAKLLGRSGSRR
ncbi:hypothetical protein [Tautonia sociabilis]|uniref:Uncharacterized protein n=1 Tax=Tautonia sociabilis TaxID=2080755 RepID=A0A432MDB8_9BACT|nr:hypothetical protein [Tautonia sociabilis]RUL81999.1 hypothetical protein TsocGM_24145 [Tautonia sociabilis]